MSSESKDPEISKLFDLLRSEKDPTTPSFDELWENAAASSSANKTRRAALAIAGAAAALAVSFILLCLNAIPDSEELSQLCSETLAELKPDFPEWNSTRLVIQPYPLSHSFTNEDQ